ncbi:hypothetical protein ASC78_00785 [Variovorax sp. Root318D1]|uniref:hypothetical protein n=1 Tax=Variovorax sp. Root318D1 TaxID=1736513 RepID=UPI0006F59260|nr:hypothetical protein [Variovorax sp. Root318D1]KQU91508.1 hypothetical protein ASC78_00785 [Variovorax sp. Root318D1]
MGNDFTFPLALCKAQWSIGLHALAALETCGAQSLALGAQLLEDASASRRADADAASRAADWRALGMLPTSMFWRAVADWAPPLAQAPDRRGDAVVQAFRTAGTDPPRQVVVRDALRTLDEVLNAPGHPRRSAIPPTHASPQ